jgi:hypothetical protein
MNNREWVFSGVGVALIGGIVSMLMNRREGGGMKQTQKSGGNSINIQAGNDLRIQKNNDK